MVGDRRLRIGFSFNLSNAGPANFLRTLRKEMDRKEVVSTSNFINPFTHCNIYSNKVNNFWGRPYIYRVDGVAYDRGLGPSHREDVNNMLEQGIKEAVGVVYQSRFSRRQVEEVLGVHKKNSTIIINGTDLKAFGRHGEDVRKELGMSADSIVLVSTAKWRPAKRIDAIVSVFEKYRKGLDREVWLLLIGEGSHGVSEKEGIVIIPKVEHRALPRYIRAGDVFLFFSWLDTCPNSVVEAIACGLPVVCTNQGGTREIVESTNGGIVVEVDEDVDLFNVNLLEPPQPDINILVDAVDKVASELEYYKKRINTCPIDIKMVCDQYVKFIKQSIGKD